MEPLKSHQPITTELQKDLDIIKENNPFKLKLNDETGKVEIISGIFNTNLSSTKDDLEKKQNELTQETLKKHYKPIIKKFINSSKELIRGKMVSPNKSHQIDEIGYITNSIIEKNFIDTKRLTEALSILEEVYFDFNKELDAFEKSYKAYKEESMKAKGKEEPVPYSPLMDILKMKIERLVSEQPLLKNYGDNVLYHLNLLDKICSENELIDKKDISLELNKHIESNLQNMLIAITNLIKKHTPS
jgi:hypothetical protein